jgi:enamine deaminase RidA (YjgF/YER057c/UK114 family)
MSNAIERLHVGPRLSEASIFNHVVYLAGQVPEKTAGGGIREQVAEVLAAVDRLLAEAGTDKTRILSCQIFLRDIADIGEMNAVWEQWVPAGHCPCRATVQAHLAKPEWGVEMVMTAALR